MNTITDTIKILIVDDDQPLSSLVARILTKSGRFVTRVENNPRAATTTALEFKPDVCLLDVDMPGCDGGTVLGDLRRHPELASIPAAFMTSLVSGSETRHRLVERGGDYYLAKTLDLGTIERSVHQLLENAAVAAR